MPILQDCDDAGCASPIKASMKKHSQIAIKMATPSTAHRDVHEQMPVKNVSAE